jgi:hypothetical protein
MFLHTLTEMWDTLNYLKNLQLLKSKVDLLEPSDLKDQLLLEIERHQNCLSISEITQILGSSEKDQSECGKAHSNVRDPKSQNQNGGYKTTNRLSGSPKSQVPEGYHKGMSLEEQIRLAREEEQYI